MSSDKDVWESQYLRKGEVWRGRSELPFDISHGKVLELGCGNGKTASALISTGIAPVCMDISRNALIECSRTVEPTVLPMIEGDVMNMPFIEEVFDSMICFHVLEHLMEDERHKAAKEMSRVLKNSGHIYIQSFSVNDMRYAKGTMIEEDSFERGDGVRYHYFRDGEIEALFDELVPVAIKHKVIEKRYHGRTLSRDMIQLDLVKNKTTS